jgi:SAM-dependent methyltransferase
VVNRRQLLGQTVERRVTAGPARVHTSPMSTDARWAESMPEIYDRCLGPVLFEPYAEQLGGIVGQLPARRVLELAAGTGIATAALISALPDASITATDLNPAMVEWGRDRVPGADWQQADAQHLGFADASFELVTCQFGVMFFPDKPAAFAEVARVLSPGATMVFSVWDAVEASDFPAAMVQCLAEVLPVDPPGFIVRVPHGYADPERIAADVSAGGLTVNAVTRVVLPTTATSARVIAEGFCLGTPLRFALQERGDLGALTDALADAMVTRLGDGPVHGALSAFVVTASTA